MELRFLEKLQLNGNRYNAIQDGYKSTLEGIPIGLRLVISGTLSRKKLSPFASTPFNILCLVITQGNHLFSTLMCLFD